MDLRSRNSSCEIKRNIFLTRENRVSRLTRGTTYRNPVEIDWKIRERRGGRASIRRVEKEGKKEGRTRGWTRGKFNKAEIEI